MTDQPKKPELNYRTFDDPQYVEIEYIDAVSNNTQGWYSPDEILATKQMPNFPLLTRGWLIAEDDRSYMVMYARVGPMNDDTFEYSVDFVIQKGPGTTVRKIKIKQTRLVKCRPLQTPEELAEFAKPKSSFKKTCDSVMEAFELKPGQRVRILHGGAYHALATIQSKRQNGYYRVLIDDDDCGESGYHYSDLEAISTYDPNAYIAELEEHKGKVDRVLNDIHERLHDDD